MQNQDVLVIQFFTSKVLAFISVLIFPIIASAAPSDTADSDTEKPDPPTLLVYRSPSERREAGLGTPITNWLNFSGLVEVEKHRNQFSLIEQKVVNRLEPTTTTLQAALLGKISDWLEADLIFEVVNDNNLDSRLDEGVISADLDDWGVKAGLLYLPFGEYYSHFVTGPMLEFAETRRYAVQVDYAVSDSIEFSVFGFNSEVNRNNNQDIIDWGLSFEMDSVDESIRFGISFISDLAESEESLLGSKVTTYKNRAPALSSYILFGFDQGEITMETVRALTQFDDLPDKINKPISTNIECAYFLRHDLQFAIRLAQSSELQAQPERQYGVSVAWRALENSLLSVDLLHGRYKGSFYFDSSGNEIKSVNELAVQLAVEF